MKSGAESQTFFSRVCGAAARALARLGRVFRAFGGVREMDLRPGGQIEALAAGSWRATGRDPYFLADAHFSPGWVRIVARIESTRGGLAQFYWDEGEGFSERDSVFLTDISGARPAAKFVLLKRPVRALRFDPADAPQAGSNCCIFPRRRCRIAACGSKR